MKRLGLLIVAFIGVAILATLKIRKRPKQPETPPGSWELAEDTKQT
ncbi:MAG: hypothetical protein ACR2N7_04465 [Acidimicrobiia bacterium]